MTITIPGEPRTKKNSMRVVTNGGKPVLLPSKAFMSYQAKAGWYLTGKGDKISYPINLKCEYYMSTKRKVDLANLIGATCDILAHYGVIADDNSKIVVSHDGSRVMLDKENPRAVITIERVK